MNRNIRSIEVYMNTIRKAIESDIKGIVKLLLQVDMIHHNARPDIFKGPAHKYTEDELKDLLNDENTYVFVCVDEHDNVIGHAFCVCKQKINHNVLTDIKTLYIDDICVDENMRGKNIGKSLYDFVVDYAKENDFYNITLNVWECNPGAIEFYKKMGLVPQRITMEKILKD